MSVTGSGFDCSRNVKIGKTAYPANVLYTSVETTSKQHPAVFPESIPEFFIKLFTVECDLVLDPFLGSGTSGVVARRLKRNFIGIEKEAEYISLAKKRIDAIKVFFPESDWQEEEKEKQDKVPFEILLKEQLIKAGEPL